MIKIITFVDILFALFIILSHRVTESSNLLAKYSKFSQLHVAGFQV